MAIFVVYNVVKRSRIPKINNSSRDRQFFASNLHLELMPKLNKSTLLIYLKCAGQAKIAPSSGRANLVLSVYGKLTLSLCGAYFACPAHFKCINNLDFLTLSSTPNVNL